MIRVRSRSTPLRGDCAILARIAIPALLVAACSCYRGGAGELGASGTHILIRNVTIVDPRAGDPKRALRRGQSVLLAGNRIVRVGGGIQAAAGARVVDGSNKYLIPGLWDMHVHTLPRARIETFFPLFVAHGVTGVRDMAMTVRDAPASMAEFVASRQWRGDVAAGTRLGPRIVAGGLLIDGSPGVFPFALSVPNADSARRAVQALKAAGVEFIKAYGLLTREAYFALADASRSAGLPFAGHVPMAVSVAEASDAGQKSIEHLNNVLLGVSSREDELRAARLAATTPTEISRIAVAQDDEIVNSYNADKARTLFERFRRNGTWQAPTLTVLRSFAFGGDSAFLASQRDRLRFMTPNFAEAWDPARNQIMRIRLENPRTMAGVRNAYRRNIALVGEMHRAGVPILAATDTPNPWVFPGFSLHDELELLVQAGLSPLDALRAATWNPAVYLGKESELGSVDAGKLADLVLLDGNPVEDISRTRSIAAVFVNGRLLDRVALDSLLSAVEARASR